jgi:hypothetical protein
MKSLTTLPDSLPFLFLMLSSFRLLAYPFSSCVLVDLLETNVAEADFLLKQGAVYPRRI